MTNSRASRNFWDKTIIKLADQLVTSSTTLVDDDELITALIVGTYIGECWAHIDGTATGDFKGCMAFSGTADGNTFGQIGATWGNQPMGTAISEAQSVYPYFSKYEFIIEVTVAGNLSLKWAQNTSDGTATKVLKGSILSIRKTI